MDKKTKKVVEPVFFVVEESNIYDTSEHVTLEDALSEVGLRIGNGDSHADELSIYEARKVEFKLAAVAKGSCRTQRQHLKTFVTGSRRSSTVQPRIEGTTSIPWPKLFA